MAKIVRQIVFKIKLAIWQKVEINFAGFPFFVYQGYIFIAIGDQIIKRGGLRSH